MGRLPPEARELRAIRNMAGGSLDGIIESAAPVESAAGARRASRLGDRRVVPTVTVEYAVASGGDDGMTRGSKAGVESWSYAHPDALAISGVTVDADANIYAAASAFDQDVTKLDPAGGLIWRSIDFTVNLHCVAIDPSRNVFAGTATQFVKLDSGGAVVWQITTPTDNGDPTVWGCAADSDGSSYAGNSHGYVAKYDAAGGELWRFAGHTDDVRDVAIAGDGVVSTSYDSTVRKIDVATGAEQWSHALPARGYAIAADAAGVVAVGYGGTFSGGVRKLDAAGGLLWDVALAARPFGVAIDGDGNVYTASAGNNAVRRHASADGAVEWEFTGHTDTPDAVDVLPGALAVAGHDL